MRDHGENQILSVIMILMFLVLYTQIKMILMLDVTVFVDEVLSSICFANFHSKNVLVRRLLLKETSSQMTIEPFNFV